MGMTKAKEKKSITEKEIGINCLIIKKISNVRLIRLDSGYVNLKL